MGNDPVNAIDPTGMFCESGPTCAQRNDEEALGAGEISEAEYTDRSQARAVGGIAGAAVGVTSVSAGVAIAGTAVRLTVAQQARVNAIRNIISNNAKPHDFAGVTKELKGIKTGFDHVTEMRQSVRGLEKAIKGVEGSLKNPNLSDKARSELTKSMNEANKVLEKMKDTLNGK